MILTIIIAVAALVVGGLGGYLVFRYILKGKYNEMIDAAAKEADVMKEKKPANIVQTAFVTNMDEAYRAADLVVSRAGASSISELQLLGKAAILVPSPNVAEDHQTKNAKALVDKQAAVMVTDADASGKLVSSLIELVSDDAKLKSLSENISKMALRNSVDKIVDKVMELIGK